MAAAGRPRTRRERDPLSSCVVSAHLDHGSLRGERWAQRAIMAALIAFLGLGVFDRLGLRTASVNTAVAGTTLRVEYPAVSRPGLHAPLAIVVRQPGGFDGPVHVAIDRAYLRLFDHAEPRPQPQSTDTTEGVVTWTFAAPRGETLRVDLDMRTAPDTSAGAAGFAALGDGSRELARVGWRTTIFP